MVASRKPARGERRPNESLEAMFIRLAESASVAAPAFTPEEARYVARRLYETGDPSVSAPGDEVMKRYYGLWPESDEYPSDESG